MVGWFGIVAPASAGTIEAPIELSIGPTAYWLAGREAKRRNTTLHTGLRLRVGRVITEREIREHRDEAGLPVSWHEQARFAGHVTLSVDPWSLLLPNEIIVSPSVIDESAMYGASWRFFSLGYQLIPEPRRTTMVVSAAPRLTVAQLTTTPSRNEPSVATWFVRPGLDVEAEIRWRLADSIRLGLGYTQHFYPPQRLGGGVLEFGPFQETIWTIGQPWVVFHLRFPSSLRY